MSAAIRVELELDDGTFTSRMVHAGETVQQFERNVGQGITSISRMSHESEGLLSSMRDLTVTLAVAGHAIHNLEAVTTSWAGEIVHINAEFERMVSMMKSFSTAADPIKDATKNVHDLRQMAASAPFSLQAIHDSFLRLKSGGLDPMNGSMKALMDGVAAFGGGDEVLKRASLALQEMSGKGVVQMKELRNQLGMAIPTALPALARALGISYEKLMSDVHTGTVDAKATIAALTAELDRAFGGAAERQMQTFNGQVARTAVLLQGLAIEHVGKAGYFDAIKQQVVEFNNFLESSTAAGLGDMLGSGLTTGVNVLREVLDLVIRFRSEIGAAGEALALVFAGKVIFSGAQQLVGAFQSVRTELTLLGVAARTANSAIDMNNFRMEYQAVVGAGQGGMSRLAGTWANTTAIMGLLGTTIGTVLPWLAILAPAVMAVADHFGLFHDRAAEAEESLRKFGAATREEAAGGQLYIDNLQRTIDQYDRLKAAHDKWLLAYKAGTSGDTPEPIDPGDDTGMAEKRKSLAAARAAQPGFESQGLTAEAKERNKQIIQANDALIAEEQRQWNVLEKARGDAFDAADKERNKAGVSGKEAETAYQDDKKRSNIALYDKEIAANEKLIDQARELRALQDDPANKGLRDEQAKQLEGRATAEINRLREARMAAQNQLMGAQLNRKPVDDEKLLARGQEALARINDKIAEFSGGLEGLDPRVAEISQRLEHMKFGDENLQSVKDLKAEMIAATGEADRLQEALRGQQKFENDLHSTRENQAEQIFKLTHDGNMSDFEQLKVKVDGGNYKGVGPNRQAAEDLLKVRDALDLATAAGKNAGVAMHEAFAGPAKSSLDVFIGQLNTAVQGMNGLAGVMGHVQFGMGQMPGMSGSLLAGSDYMTKLINRESSGNPNAGADNPKGAVGLGQFLPGTWESYLAATHPDLKGRDDLRTDPTLAKQAIAWYTAQNAQGLASRGFQASDANLYTAHYLGLGGASRVLGGDPSTRFADDPYFAKAVAKNKELMNGTYGSVYGRIQSQFGTGMSGVGGAGSVPGGHTARADGMPSQKDADDYAAAARDDAKIKKLTDGKNFSDRLMELRSGIDAANANDDGSHKALSKLVADIKAGKINREHLDPKDGFYKDLTDSANAQDSAEGANAERKKAKTKADGAIENTRKAMLDQQQAHDDLWAQMTRPGSLASTSKVLAQQKSNTESLDAVKGSYGAESPEYAKQLADNQRLLDGARNEEISKNVQGLDQKTAKLREALMTQDDAQASAYDREVARYKKDLDAFTGTAEEKKRLTDKVNAYTNAYGAKAAASSPIAKQFQQWSDLTHNFQSDAASWMNSSVNSMTQLITTGKTNWRSLTQGITSDLVSMGLKAGIGSVGGALKGTGKGGGGMLGSLFGSAAGGGGLFGIGHNATGDNNFAGGLTWVGEKGPELVGLPGGSNIMPAGTAPAMAQEGAGSSQATMSGATINSGTTNHITVSPVLQANGGTPAQNTDLAKQMSGHLEDTVRRIWADEAKNQMRPGGMLDGTNSTRR